MTGRAMVKRIDTDLPSGWAIVEYSELNHHITLVDDEGRHIRLEAEHMVKYTCDKCGEVLYGRSNHSRIICPCGYTMKAEWSQAQISFIPDQELKDDEPTDPQVLV